MSVYLYEIWILRARGDLLDRKIVSVNLLFKLRNSEFSQLLEPGNSTIDVVGFVFCETAFKVVVFVLADLGGEEERERAPSL